MTIDHQLFPSLGIEPNHALYPGHPITIAFCITRAFDSYAAAVQKKDGTAAAMSSMKVPGCGGCVASALDLLTDLHKGIPFEEAIRQSDATWDRIDNHQNGGGIFAKDEESRQRFLQRWKEGQAQADLIKPLLAQNPAWWTA